MELMSSICHMLDSVLYLEHGQLSLISYPVEFIGYD
jgi:hypothetical protein